MRHFCRSFPTVCSFHNLVYFGVHALDKNDTKAAAAKIKRDVIGFSREHKINYRKMNDVQVHMLSI